MVTENQSHWGDVLFVSSAKAWRFSNPDSTIACYDSADVIDALQRVDAAIAQGYYVAGFLSYEAGWSLLGRTPTRCLPEFPLLWFGVYSEPESVPKPSPSANAVPSPSLWQPLLNASVYQQRFKRIRDYIGAGDVYQINFTFPLTAQFHGDPAAWFWQLHNAQPTDHAAYLDLGHHQVLSLSPELFFQLEGTTLTTRPMKGTLPRGLYPEADAQARAQLAASEKDRAENVMIVDLLRNDMGRVSETGSVEVAALFDIERYATVWQMTSAIQSQTAASFSEIMTALFPSGSVTGAPKIRAMEIIDALETWPRGIYCGAVGWWGPNRRAAFNVAIRTLTLDTQSRQATYPVGGGITWYSNAADEYAECIAKARTIMYPAPAFSLLESIRYDGAFVLLEEHLDRLCASAAHFDIPVNRQQIRDALSTAAARLPRGQWRMRLLVHRDGSHNIEASPLPKTSAPEALASTPPGHTAPLQVALAASPVHMADVFLYHKTTRRAVYEDAKKEHPGADDVLLWNEAGELTESTIANIVAKVQGELVTPPVSCGLLAGVMRGHLLRTGVIKEAVIHKRDLEQLDTLYLVNSVRGWMPVALQAHHKRK